MIKIASDQKHSRAFWICSLSRLLERASFYGFRSIITLYFVNALHMNTWDASIIYSIFIIAFSITPILGGLLGDLLLGTKRTMVIGGLIQAAGLFICCIPSQWAMYTGLVCMIIGNGLFSANILSGIGKLYLNKPELMDAGFTIFYLAVNIGIFFGQGLIPFIGNYSFKAGFIACGILMLLSVSSIMRFPKAQATDTVFMPATPLSRRIFIIFSVLILLGIFRSIYNVGCSGLILIESKLTYSTAVLYPIVGSIITLVIGIIASILWSFYSTNYLKKLTWGFFLGAIAFALCILMSFPSPMIYLSSLFFLGVSEILVAPVLYSTLTNNSNPKYLAIILSLSFIPVTLFTALSQVQLPKFQEYTQLLEIGAIGFLIMGLILLIFLLIRKRKPAPIHP